MDHDREQRIRARAHAIWEREGHPEGREDEHWRLASDEIEREDSGSGMGALSVAMEPELVSTGLTTEDGMSGIAGGLVPETPNDRRQGDQQQKGRTPPTDLRGIYSSRPRASERF